MVILWTQEEEKECRSPSRPSSSPSFDGSQKGSPSFPGSAPAGAGQPSNGLPPKPPPTSATKSTHLPISARGNVNPSMKTSMRLRGDEVKAPPVNGIEQHLREETCSEKLVVAVKDTMRSPKIVQLSKSEARFSPQKFSTPVQSKPEFSSGHSNKSAKPSLEHSSSADQSCNGSVNTTSGSFLKSLEVFNGETSDASSGYCTQSFDEDKGNNTSAGPKFSSFRKFSSMRTRTVDVSRVAGAARSQALFLNSTGGTSEILTGDRPCETGALSSENQREKKDRKRFYSLPRNWRGKATDFIWSKGKTLCAKCGKKCSGEVLRVQDKYFHVQCFNCKSCGESLAQGGFFTRAPDHYCTTCYQQQFGTRCHTCGQYVEGEVVSALGKTYHQSCFTCDRCRQPFPTGERVTYTGKECLCLRCFQIPVRDTQSPAPSPSHPGPRCAGCSEELSEGQALIALDRQWHIWCFKCTACGTLLHGEYMGKDGQPYCEKDYQSQFGVRCVYCSRFISGKVLQAGDNHHFHPTCARCTKCGDPFGDGEEMYLQGTAIWHPRCGPGPTESGTVINGHAADGHEAQTNGHANGHKPPEKDLDGVSSTASETQYSGQYRTCSPGLILREYNKSSRSSPVDISRIYTYSYLAAEPSQGYLKKPIDPYDRPPKSPHFHRPPGGDTGRGRAPLGKAPSRTGMRVLVNQIQSETPRPKSPHMNNEEPITLAHFPGGQKPKQNQPSRIEREDFPAPPYPYTDPERRRRWSGSSKGASVDESDEHLDDVDGGEGVPPEDPKLKREEAELAKISSGIGKVFLQQVKEREKIRAWKATHLDPRNASRTPSATREPSGRLRFDSSYNASPSRVIDGGGRWTDDDYDGHPSYRSSGRSSATLPSYSVVSSLRQPPKPGYGFSPRTNYYRPGLGSYSALHGDTTSLTGMGDKTHSTDFSSARSDVSAGSLNDADRSVLTGGGGELCASATYSSGLRGYSSSRYSPHLRRSLPNMLHPHHPHHPHHIHNQDQPPKIYPAHLLFTTNYRLPHDVDRCHLERHLSDQDFEMVFRMTRMDFYRMPEWQRNELKRRCHFF